MKILTFLKYKWNRSEDRKKMLFILGARDSVGKNNFTRNKSEGKETLYLENLNAFSLSWITSLLQ